MVRWQRPSNRLVAEPREFPCRVGMAHQAATLAAVRAVGRAHPTRRTRATASSLCTGMHQFSVDRAVGALCAPQNQGKDYWEWKLAAALPYHDGPWPEAGALSPVVSASPCFFSLMSIILMVGLLKANDLYDGFISMKG